VDSSKKNTLYCSWCGKSQHEVSKLIAGPTVFICDECVELCMDIIKEEDRQKQRVSADSYPEFCGVEIPPIFVTGKRRPGSIEVLSLLARTSGELEDVPEKIGHAIIMLRRDEILQHVMANISAVESNVIHLSDRFAGRPYAFEQLTTSLNIYQASIQSNTLSEEDTEHAKKQVQAILTEFEQHRKLREYLAKIAYLRRYLARIEKVRQW